MGWLGDFFNGLFGFAKNERQIAANKSLQEDAQAFNFEMQKDAQRYNSAEAEKAFARQEEFYIKHSSPAAQIASLRSAGVNPFSLGGTGNGPVASSSPASSGASSSGVGSVGTLSNPLDAIIQMARLKMEQEANDANVAKTKAETRSIETNTSWLDEINSTSLEKMRSEIKSNQGAYDKAMQDIKESLSRIDVNNSTIVVNGERIKLMGSQRDLNASVQAINQLDAQKAEMLLPYVQARAEADIAYTTAKTAEARNSAERLMYEANMSMLGVMREADLIDKGYYDYVVSQAEWEAKSAKRDYKWKPVNDICSNVSKIAVGVGSVLSGVASLKGVPSAPSVPVAPATLTFF